LHANIHVINVESAADMYEAATKVFPDVDAGILCAAVADFTPSVTAESKIKRKGEITITLQPTQDIAAAVGRMKRKGQVLVGFALETDNEQVNAEHKLAKKNLDFIVLNSLRDKGAGFRHDTNKITIIRKDLTTIPFPLKDKTEVAKDIVDETVNSLRFEV